MERQLPRASAEMSGMSVPRSIVKYNLEGGTTVEDYLAIEEPLEIRLSFGNSDLRQQKSISITMRTPGHDSDLALGFLYTEGIIRSIEEIDHVELSALESNVLMVSLKDDLEVDLGRLERHFYTSSSCGVCGKTSLEALRSVGCDSIHTNAVQLASRVIYDLPEKLRSHQEVFEETGGLHASALFTIDGSIQSVREDVGRHNAVDKLIGHLLSLQTTSMDESVLLVSGRASFELVQKCLMASIPIMVAVGAPSSLAAELAEEYGLTLIGFASRSRFNVYANPQRIIR